MLHILLVSRSSGHVTSADFQGGTDGEILRQKENTMHGFYRGDWTVHRIEGDYHRAWNEAFLIARIRRIVSEISDRHENAFYDWLEALPPLFPPDPPPKYRDPYATIDWPEWLE
jgi:hypothetical protein